MLQNSLSVAQSRRKARSKEEGDIKLSAYAKYLGPTQDDVQLVCSHEISLASEMYMLPASVAALVGPSSRTRRSATAGSKAEPGYADGSHLTITDKHRLWEMFESRLDFCYTVL